MVHEHPVEGTGEDIGKPVRIREHREDIVGMVQEDIPYHKAYRAGIYVNTKNTPCFSSKNDGKRAHSGEHVKDVLPLVLKPRDSLSLGGKTW